MIQADMHMHTWFSTDSEACPCGMADEAVRKGLKNHLLYGSFLTRMIWNGEKKVSLMWMLILWKCRNFRKNMQEN
mgnify:FL=1